jgi:DNA-binding MarR family transcriptional regulator
MTVKSDLASFAPTVVARNVFAAKGVNLTSLMTSLQQHAVEMQAIVKQVISFHPNDSVLSATVNAGGSGGTNGPVTITGTTGTGTKFQAKGVISGGALTGITSITNAGSYTTDPTSLTAEPVTGGNPSAPMTISMLLTFVTIAKHGRISVNDLAKAVGINQSAISRQLQDMSAKDKFGAEGLGLFEQRIEGTYTLNSLTTKGQALARRMAAAMDRVSRHPVKVAA